MKILVLHLSDIHIRSGKGKNIVMDRTEKMVDVVNEHAQGLDTCFVVVSGDVASSGNCENYLVASDFFNLLRKRTESVCRGLSLKYVMVPGNHDCDFEKDDYVRHTMISTLPKRMKDLKDLKDYSLINKCTSIQEAFFNFLYEFSDVKDFRDVARIHYRQQFSIGNYRISFDCFNTSWMSQKDEEQGKIIFPIDLVTKDRGQSDLILSVFHHTYNWLEASNAKLFKNHVEGTSEIILTGHEHDLDYVTQTKITGEMNQYGKGGILQGKGGDEKSEFNLLLVDLQEKKVKILQYKWISDMYSKKEESEWFSLPSSRSSRLRRFVNNTEYDKYLNNPGIDVTHPKKGYLSLDDIFLWPDLKEIHASGQFSLKTVRSTDCIDYVKNNAKIVVFGPDKSGKTALAKKIYRELLKQDMVPVLMKGASIKSCKKEEYLRLIKREFSKQYNQELLEKYSQLQREKRIVLIDDFNRAELNMSGKACFIDALRDFAKTIIVFNDDLSRIEELLSQKDCDNPFSGFKICETIPFGRLQRERMIERWLSLGREHSVDPEKLVYEIDRIEKVIDTLLRKGVLPSYPVFVLIILQTIEANISLKTVSGSYGYLYDVLITMSLRKTGAKPSIDTKYTYLSEMAYHMFSNDVTELTDSDIENLGQRYYDKYAVRIKNEKMTKDLTKSRMLAKSGDSYILTFKYIYYYFIARYIRDNMRIKESEERMRKCVTKMSKELFREDYANIMIFLSYFSKDQFIIDELLKNAKEIYKDYPLCDLERDVRFLEDTSIRTSEIVLPDREVRDRRQERLRIKDDKEMIKNNSDHRSGSEDEVSGDLMRINSAFKTLEILGQIVRGFSGSLRADMKLTLIEECYSIGLRTLKFIVSFLEINLEEVKEVLFGLEEDKRTATNTGFENRKAEFVGRLVQGISYNIIKRISYSAGCEELRELYKKVLDKYDLKSVYMIDMSIKLDHFGQLPLFLMKEIVDFYGQIKNNIFLAEMLRFMVSEHFYMFPVDHKKRQKLVAELRPKKKIRTTHHT